jgi:hypothetical protein
MTMEVRKNRHMSRINQDFTRKKIWSQIWRKRGRAGANHFPQRKKCTTVSTAAFEMEYFV